MMFDLRGGGETGHNGPADGPAPEPIRRIRAIRPVRGRILLPAGSFVVEGDRVQVNVPAIERAQNTASRQVVLDKRETKWSKRPPNGWQLIEGADNVEGLGRP